MTPRDQLTYFAALGLDPKDVTDANERKEAESSLKLGGQWDGQMSERFKTIPLEITDVKAVKTAWKKKCMNFHPDKFDQKAYQTYIDSLKRCAEDGEECEDEIVLSKEDMEQRFKEVTHAYKMLTDASYANKFKSEHFGGQRGLEAAFSVAIDFEQAFFGDNVSITFNPLHVDDSGKPVKINKEKDVFLDAEVLQIRVREGVKTGDQVRVPQKGLCQGDRRGDMVITFQVIPHYRFQIQGSDIVDSVKIPLDMMLVGGEIDVLTMWGTETLRVPAASRPDDKLEIKNKGVSKVGSHIVIVTPMYPDKSELKEKTVWKKLGINWKTEKDKDDQQTKDGEEYDQIFEALGGFQFASGQTSAPTRRWSPQ